MKLLKTQSLVLAVMCVLAVCSFAQTKAAKTVTNAELDKYRQERVKAEEDYRQNYARLGLPSPEQLDKQDAERMKRMTEFSQQLRAERRQVEYMEQMRSANSGDQVVYVNSGGGGYSPYLYPGFYGGVGTFDNGFGFGRGDFGRFGFGGRFGNGGKFFFNTGRFVPRFGINTSFGGIGGNGTIGGIGGGGPRAVMSPRR